MPSSLSFHQRIRRGTIPRRRSGETPKKLLGGTKGTLMVDAYSGNNVVAEVSKRKRAACHAPLRRYFHEALPWRRSRSRRSI